MSLSEILSIVSFALGLFLVAYLIYIQFNNLDNDEEETPNNHMWEDGGNEHSVWRHEPVQGWDNIPVATQVTDNNIQSEPIIEDVEEIVITEPVKVVPKKPRPPRKPKVV